MIPNSLSDRINMKTYYAKSQSDITGVRWLLMKRISKENGGGSVCVQVFQGNQPRARARYAAAVKNGEFLTK